MIVEKFNRLLRVDAVDVSAVEATLRVSLEDGRVLECARGRDADGRLLLWLPDHAFLGPPNRVLVEAGAGDTRARAVFAVGRDAVEGACERVSQGLLRGWCARQVLDGGLNEADFVLSVDGRKVPADVSLVYRRDLVERSLNGGFDGFAVALPSGVFDGEAHSFALRVRGVLLSSAFETYRFEPVGSLDVVEPGQVTGWCFEPDAADDEALPLRVISDSGAALPVVADRAAGAGMGAGERRCGFSVTLPSGARAVRIVPAFAPEMDLFHPGAFVPMVDQVEAVSRIAAAVRSGSALEEDDAHWLRTVGFDAILASIRAGGRHGPARAAGAYRRPVIDGRGPGPVPPRGVTVVVPVYDDLAATRRCLEALAASDLPDDARILVIDDATPSADLAMFLRAFCPAHAFTLRHHRTNCGFVATVNEGIAAAGRDDVVLLNADTLVPPGWLQRLRELAQSHPEIGSITPMSNNATILSWPLSNVENPTPDLDQTVRIDGLFREHNAQRLVDLPTGHGFCLYLTRPALDEVGLIDPIWGRGYGDENDWCLRASAHGFRHLAACNVFVAHEGSKSFGASKRALVERNGGILRERYPEYQELIQNFLRRDPLREARNAVAVAELAQRRTKLALHLMNHLGGGVQRFVLDTSLSQYRDGALPLFLTRAPGQELVADPDYEIRSFAPVLHLRFSASELPDMLARLTASGLTTIHLHTLAGIDFRILPDLFEAPAEIVTTIHDYSWTCPRIFLLQGSSTFCGQPPSEVCERCIATYGTHPNIDFVGSFESVAEYRAFARSILEQSDAVVAVSEDARRRVHEVHPDFISAVVPGLEIDFARPLRAPQPRSGQRRVAVPGAIGDHKGYELLLATAKAAAAAESPLRFVVVGHTRDDAALRALGNVEITGSFDPGEGARLLSQARAEVGLLLSPWPETFSYTLSECWAAGLPTVCLDIGAPPARVREQGGGWVLPRASEGAAVLAALEEILRGGEPIAAASRLRLAAPPGPVEE